MTPMTQAAQDVLTERARQVSAEGWTPEHDDEHGDGAMASAAAVYCLCREGPQKPGEPSELHSSRRWGFNILRAIWPSGWHFNPKERRQNLVRAAALLLAEIERLDRARGVTVTVPVNRPATPEEAEHAARIGACLPNGAMFDAFGRERVRYVRVIHDGTTCVVSPGDVADLVDPERPEDYRTEDVYLSKEEFDALPEFNGF